MCLAERNRLSTNRQLAAFNKGRQEQSNLAKVTVTTNRHQGMNRLMDTRFGLTETMLHYFNMRLKFRGGVLHSVDEEAPAEIAASVAPAGGTNNQQITAQTKH
jgi:hypothetical protein